MVQLLLQSSPWDQAGDTFQPGLHPLLTLSLPVLLPPALPRQHTLHKSWVPESLCQALLLGNLA